MQRIDKIAELCRNGDSNGNKMLRLLEDVVPVTGPPKSEHKCKPLRNSVLEFKCGSKHGLKFRVLFFYDRGRVVVCSEAFTKAEETPTAPIDRTAKLKDAYDKAAISGSLEIMEYEDWEDEYCKE